MHAVTQRTTGNPHGECVRASYATLLSLPIELVPALDPGSLLPGERQAARERNWLSMLGLSLLEIPAEMAHTVPPAVLGAPHLVSGLSPRGFYHRCVGQHGKVLFDPHPSRAGLVTITSLGFLVPCGG